MNTTSSISYKTASPIFIVAARRSGTTLLKTILNQHSAIRAHPDEPQFILELYEKYGLQISNMPTAVEFLAKHPLRAKSVSETAVQKAYKHYDHLSLTEFINIYIQLWPKNAAKRILLKHPRFVFHLNGLQAIFPKVTVVHIVRDPRANVASQINRWPNLSVWECASFWKTAVEAARRWATSNPEKYIEIQYENLLQEPEKTTKSICNQLSLPYEPEMLTFHEETRYYSAKNQSQSVTLTAVDNTRLNLWQKQLSPVEIKLIESCCHREMTGWDYPSLNPTPPFWHYTRHYLSQRLLFTKKMILRTVKKVIRQI